MLSIYTLVNHRKQRANKLEDDDSNGMLWKSALYRAFLVFHEKLLSSIAQHFRKRNRWHTKYFSSVINCLKLVYECMEFWEREQTGNGSGERLVFGCIIHTHTHTHAQLPMFRCKMLHKFHKTCQVKIKH